MTSAPLLPFGFAFLSAFFQYNGEIRAVEVAKAALRAIFKAYGTGEIIPFLIHLVGKIVHFFGTISNTKPTSFTELFDNGNGHFFIVLLF
jgi:hypothetical protein